jgi:hypothetical protein
MVESNTISQDTISSFANVLRQNKTLTSLSIGASSTSHNGTYGLDKMKIFAEALAENTTLKSLRYVQFLPSLLNLFLFAIRPVFAFSFGLM